MHIFVLYIKTPMTPPSQPTHNLSTLFNTASQNSSDSIEARVQDGKTTQLGGEEMVKF
jgi:hypothetical protein